MSHKAAEGTPEAAEDLGPVTFAKLPIDAGLRKRRRTPKVKAAAQEDGGEAGGMLVKAEAEMLANKLCKAAGKGYSCRQGFPCGLGQSQVFASPRGMGGGTNSLPSSGTAGII